MRGRAFSTGFRVKDRYRIQRRLGGGGMGDVYEVLDEITRRGRALKAMHLDIVDNADLRARFEQEVTITADIKSDHIVEVLDAGVDVGTGAPFIVMELLKGQDLERTLKERKRLAPGEVLGILSQVARALRKTHALGVVHRDLKPGNLFEVFREDEPSLFKVLDFGIAKVMAESGDAKTTLAIGTPYYMSPEQIRGDGRLGPAADLYAVGHLAYTLLVGEPYWKPEAARKGAALVRAICEGGAEPASVRACKQGVEVPPAFDFWFARATAVRPEDRFWSAFDLVDALAQALAMPLPRAALPTMAEELVAVPPAASRQAAGPEAIVEGPQASDAAPQAIRAPEEMPPSTVPWSQVDAWPSGGTPEALHMEVCIDPPPPAPVRMVPVSPGGYPVHSPPMPEARPVRSPPALTPGWLGAIAVLACLCAAPGVVALGLWLLRVPAPSSAPLPQPPGSALAPTVQPSAAPSPAFDISRAYQGDPSSASSPVSPDPADAGMDGTAHTAFLPSPVVTSSAPSAAPAVSPSMASPRKKPRDPASTSSTTTVTEPKTASPAVQGTAVPTASQQSKMPAPEKGNASDAYNWGK